MKKSRNLLLAMAFLFGINAFAQIPTKLESFNVSDVTLTESVFKHAEDMDIQYLMAIDPDRLLAPFLKEAGLELERKAGWKRTRKGIVRFADATDAEKDALIAADPLYGKIVCRCEQVTEGEIVRAIRENPPAKDITAATSAADISENTENPEVSGGNTVKSS